LKLHISSISLFSLIVRLETEVLASLICGA
jgi:hypothetical protein